MKPFEKILNAEDMISPGITACQGCNVELTLRIVMKLVGRNSILAISPGCMAGTRVVGWGTESSCKMPVTCPMLPNTASPLSGSRTYYHPVGRDDIKGVGFAGDGGTVDIGFQSLSAAAERGDNIMYVCYDNEGYMNTGFQRSSSTTKGASTTTTPVGKVIKGKRQHKKDIPLIMAMHNIPYVATCSPAYMPDLIRKVEKAIAVKDGLAYLHVYNTCATGWGYPMEKSLAVSKLSVQTRFFPLYEVENGDFRLTVQVPNPKPVKEFLESMRKFSHLTPEDKEALQQWVDKKWDRLMTLCDIGKEAASPGAA